MSTWPRGFPFAGGRGFQHRVAVEQQEGGPMTWERKAPWFLAALAAAAASLAAWLATTEPEVLQQDGVYRDVERGDDDTLILTVR